MDGRRDETSIDVDESAACEAKVLQGPKESRDKATPVDGPAEALRNLGPLGEVDALRKVS